MNFPRYRATHYTKHIPHSLRRLVQRSDEGRKALVVPLAQRLLPDMGEVFRVGYRQAVLEAAGTKSFPEGRFPVFTTRLRKGMRPHGEKGALKDARQRCAEDVVRWPFPRYEQHFLLWKEDSWRVLLPQEVEALMGVPPH